MATQCFACHTDSKLRGLQIDSREGILAGGKSGPAIVPGKPDESLLIRAIRPEDPNLKMPMRRIRGRYGALELSPQV